LRPLYKKKVFLSVFFGQNAYIRPPMLMGENGGQNHAQFFRGRRRLGRGRRKRRGLVKVMAKGKKKGKKKKGKKEE